MTNKEYLLWMLAAIASIVMLFSVSTCSHAAECWTQPHQMTDKYTKHMPGYAGKVCWHPKYQTAQKSSVRPSNERGGAFKTRSADLSQHHAYTAAEKENLFREFEDFREWYNNIYLFGKPTGGR